MISVYGELVVLGVKLKVSILKAWLLLQRDQNKAKEGKMEKAPATVFYPGEPALILGGRRGQSLVVADLHLGFERTFLDAKIAIHSQSQTIFDTLLGLVGQVKPSQVVLLGDIKHQLTYASFRDWTELPRFLDSLLQKVNRVIIIPGNHDAGLKRVFSGVRCVSTRGLLIETREGVVGLLHGHTWPAPKIFSSDVIVIGHVHPTIELRDASGLRLIEPVWLKAQVNKEKLAESFLKSSSVPTRDNATEVFQNHFKVPFNLKEVVIMPAFNRLLAGRSVNLRRQSESSFIGPILNSGGVDLLGAEVFMLDATYLGELRNMRE